MKERPILFSAPMVRAILDGRKTQTRRVVKGDHGGPTTWVERDGLWHPCADVLCRGALDAVGPGVRCPYGQRGDRLWVRETWCVADPDYAHYPADGRPLRSDDRWAWYRATEGDLVEYTNNRSPWRPSIHMPRWASRLTLEVTGVRVERLQDLSEEDARAEGVEPLGSLGRVPPHINGFADLSEQINGAASWDANPWVWVVEFRRIL